MNHVKRHIALFLMLVMASTAVPAPLVHDLFANHTDAAENHCRHYHKNLGCHLEQQQNHCHVFKANTPLYDATKLQPYLTPLTAGISAYFSVSVTAVALSTPCNIPSRGPPAA